MANTLVIFSGLPGTGKSSLAGRLARELRWPLLGIDDVAGEVPPDADFHFWDGRIQALLAVVETQLDLGLSVIVDSVFMGADRLHAQGLARKYGAAFRPVYCFVSDEDAWEERVTKRAADLDNPAVATWERITHQRQWFAPWQPGTALFVDALEPLGQNYASVREFVTKESVALRPLVADIPLTPGHYHGQPPA
jgi:predicted kinase